MHGPQKNNTRGKRKKNGQVIYSCSIAAIMLKTVINPPAELVRDEAAPVKSGADASSVELAS